MENATYAPSACNKQAWKFIVVDDDGVKARLVKNFGSQMVMNSPVGILVLYRKDVTFNSSIYRNNIQSASAAIQNLLLTAHSMGIGSCWICQLPTKRYIRKVLSTPKTYEVISYIALGYPKEYLIDRTVDHYKGDEKKAKSRSRSYAPEQIVSFNEFKEHYNLSNTQSFIKIKELLTFALTHLPRCKLQDNIDKLICTLLFKKKPDKELMEEDERIKSRLDWWHIRHTSKEWCRNDCPAVGKQMSLYEDVRLYFEVFKPEYTEIT